MLKLHANLQKGLFDKSISRRFPLPPSYEDIQTTIIVINYNGIIMENVMIRIFSLPVVLIAEEQITEKHCYKNKFRGAEERKSSGGC